MTSWETILQFTFDMQNANFSWPQVVVRYLENSPFDLFTEKLLWKMPQACVFVLQFWKHKFGDVKCHKQMLCKSLLFFLEKCISLLEKCSCDLDKKDHFSWKRIVVQWCNSCLVSLTSHMHVVVQCTCSLPKGVMIFCNQNHGKLV